MSKKKICVFTCGRADYYLLKPILSFLKKDKNIILQILASGSHFSLDHGLTHKKIIEDGFHINKNIRIPISNSNFAEIKYISSSIEKYSQALRSLSPNLTLLLGDRYETFSFAIASIYLNIPIAHISGGEITLGSIDDYLRHSITKMAYIHFPYHNIYKKRIIQMGENPKLVYNFGSIGSENITKMKIINKKSLEKLFNFKFMKRNLLITFHPSTLEKDTPKIQFKEILKSLDILKETFLIFTSANIDSGGNEINLMIKKYTKKNNNRSIFIPNLGQYYYFSFLKNIDGLVGNSSSGIYETASFKIGVLNIGKRQKGRIQNKNIINCEPNVKSISKALKLLYSENFKLRLKKVKDIFRRPKTSENIYKIIKSLDIPKNLYKSFYDL